MDKYKTMQDAKEKELTGTVDEDNHPVIEYTPLEIYRELIDEK
jgi:hypothetical protein